jgi:type II secretory pathway component GspD/PulD (secretin)
MRFNIIPVAAVLLTAMGAHAQQPKAPANPVDPSYKVSLTVRGADAKAFVDVQATSADIRAVLRELGQKSGATVYFSPSVTGSFSGTFEGVELESAITSVASSAGCKVLRIALPKDAPTITETAAGKVYDGLLAMPASATAVDVKGHKSLVSAETFSAPAADASVVYYIQGKLTPDQERAGSDKRAADKAAAAKTPSALVQSAVSAFQSMPVADRLNAMRDMQRQMFQNMTPDERQQMFQGMGGGRGGRGGPGGG